MVHGLHCSSVKTVKTKPDLYYGPWSAYHSVQRRIYSYSAIKTSSVLKQDIWTPLQVCNDCVHTMPKTKLNWQQRLLNCTTAEWSMLCEGSGEHERTFLEGIWYSCINILLKNICFYSMVNELRFSYTETVSTCCSQWEGMDRIHCSQTSDFTARVREEQQHPKKGCVHTLLTRRG